MPQNFDFTDKHVMMSTNKGHLYVWNLISDYVPPLNYNHFPFNFNINFSFEMLKV